MENGLRKTMEKLFWYHTINLGNGIKTDGIYDLYPYLKYYGLPDSMNGMSAIDVGTASGFFAFEMEKRGASPVVATDIPSRDFDYSPHVKESWSREENDEIRFKRPWPGSGFLFAKKQLNSKVEKKELNIYEMNKKSVGEYDVVFCGSLLVHLTDPVKAMMNLLDITKKYAIISTVIEPVFFRKRWAKFVGIAERTTWWSMGTECFVQMAYSVGFKKVELISTFDLASRKAYCNVPHAVIRAWKNDPPSEELAKGTISGLINPASRFLRRAWFYYKRKKLKIDL